MKLTQRQVKHWIYSDSHLILFYSHEASKKSVNPLLLRVRHTKLESTVRYLSIEDDEALEIAGQTEI